MGNPSNHVETPLTGGYLLIVLAEPRNAEHKLAILKRLTKGKNIINKYTTYVNKTTSVYFIILVYFKKFLHIGMTYVSVFYLI